MGRDSPGNGEETGARDWTRSGCVILADFFGMGLDMSETESRLSPGWHIKGGAPQVISWLVNRCSTINLSYSELNHRMVKDLGHHWHHRMVNSWAAPETMHRARRRRRRINLQEVRAPAGRTETLCFDPSRTILATSLQDLYRFVWFVWEPHNLRWKPQNFLNLQQITSIFHSP